MRDIQNYLFKFTVLIVVFFGALGPVFRADDVARYVGFACVMILFVGCLVLIFKRPPE